MVRYILTRDVLPGEVCPMNLMEHIHDEIVKFHYLVYFSTILLLKTMHIIWFTEQLSVGYTHSKPRGSKYTYGYALCIHSLTFFLTSIHSLTWTSSSRTN
jgi:hypothetical protein